MSDRAEADTTELALVNDRIAALETRLSNVPLSALSLMGSRGEPRASLAALGNGMVGLLLGDQRGLPRIGLTVSAEETNISCTDPDSTRRIDISVGAHGRIVMTLLSGLDGSHRLEAAVDAKGSPTCVRRSTSGSSSSVTSSALVIGSSMRTTLAIAGDTRSPSSEASLRPRSAPLGRPPLRARGL